MTVCYLPFRDSTNYVYWIISRKHRAMGYVIGFAAMLAAALALGLPYALVVIAVSLLIWLVLSP